MLEDKSLSPNFRLKEFRDSHNPDAQFTVDQRLISALEIIRAILNQPLRITSGYRTPATNEAVTGSKTSLHMTNPLIACDIACPNVPLYKLFEAAVKSGLLGGIGLYPDKQDQIIHIDLRIIPSRWVRINGEYHYY